MKTKLILSLLALLLFTGAARAQWTVFDPSNLMQSIVNSTNEMVETSTSAENMIRNFQETVKIYEQSKKYYDKLKSVSDLVRNARKVQECVLLTSQISDVYITSYQKMLADKNYTPKELSAIASGYTSLLQKSVSSLQELGDIVKPSEMSMTDHDRLDLINRIHGELTHYRDLTVYYTQKNISVSVLRAKEKRDAERVLSLYGDDAVKYW